MFFFNTTVQRLENNNQNMKEKKTNIKNKDRFKKLYQ